MEEILRKFESKGIVRGGILFLRSAEARELVHECEKVGARILGIDAFKLGELTTQPLMEHSITFNDLHGNHAYADSFLRDREALDLFFEIVVDDLGESRLADKS